MFARGLWHTYLDVFFHSARNDADAAGAVEHDARNDETRSIEYGMPLERRRKEVGVDLHMQRDPFEPREQEPNESDFKWVLSRDDINTIESYRQAERAQAIEKPRDGVRWIQREVFGMYRREIIAPEGEYDHFELADRLRIGLYSASRRAVALKNSPVSGYHQYAHIPWTAL